MVRTPNPADDKERPYPISPNEDLPSPGPIDPDDMPSPAPDVPPVPPAPGMT